MLKSTHILFFIVVLMAIIIAGCPIPCSRSTLLQPKGAIHVIDGKSKNPIEGAEVLLRRYRVGPPPKAYSHLISKTTNTQGEVRFDLKMGRETVMPLMMHGVPQWGFEVCVKKKGYKAAAKQWLISIPANDPESDGLSVPNLTVEIEPGESDCPWEKLELTP